MDKTISPLSQVIDAKAPQVRPIKVYTVGLFTWAVSILVVYLFLSEWFANNLGLYRQEQRWVSLCSPGPPGCLGCCYPVLQTTYLFPGFAFYFAALIVAVALPIALGLYRYRDRLVGKSHLHLIFGLAFGVLGLFVIAFGRPFSDCAAWGDALEYAGMIVVIAGIGFLTFWSLGGHQDRKPGSSDTVKEH